MVRLRIIVALAAALPANALFSGPSAVLQVNHKTYHDLIARSNRTSIVKFYAPWCGHCKNLEPTYERAAKSLSGLATVAAVDCDDESNKVFCGSMGVKGFPTLKIIKPGKKAGKPIVEDYQGARSAKAIVDAVVDKIPNHVQLLRDSNYEKWIAEGRPKTILFTDKGAVSAPLKSIAIDFLGVMGIGQIRDTEKGAVEAFKVKKFPTLILFPGEGKEHITYDGALKKEDIMGFLSEVATPNPDPTSKTDKASTKKSKASKPNLASQTQETLMGDPSSSPDPLVQGKKPAKLPETGPAKPIPSVTDGISIQQKCLNDKAGTCILALLPEDTSPSEKTTQAIRALSELHRKHELGHRNLFPFFQIPSSNSQGNALRSKFELGLSQVEIIAINGKRSWWRHYPHEAFTLSHVEDWVDAIRMGEGKKLNVPEGIIVDASELPSEPVRINVEESFSESPVGAAGSREEMEKMGKKIKNQLPAGMEYELEEISDEEYEQLMNQGKQQSVATPEQEDDHDEL